METKNIEQLINRVVVRAFLLPTMSNIVCQNDIRKWLKALAPSKLEAALKCSDANFLASFEQLLAGEMNKVLDDVHKPEKPWKYEEWNIREGLIRRKLPNPDALINCETNYLAKGSAIVYNSTTGAGKSVFTAQFMVFMACCLSFFGQRPCRKLKLLLVQNENDMYDAFEALEGAILYASRVSGMTIEEVTKCVEENCKVCRLHCTGDDLPRFLSEKVEELRATGFVVDVVIVDPLLGYFGGLLDPDRTQEWLYTKVTPVMQESKFLLVLTHHVTAAQGRAGGRNGGSYAGMGGAVLPGWVRAVCNIEPAEDQPGLFVLRYEKRARRLGDKNAWYMQQGKDGIYWEAVDIEVPVIPVKSGRLSKAEVLENKQKAKYDKARQKVRDEERLYKAIIADCEDKVITADLLVLVKRRFKCSERKAEIHIATMVEDSFLKRISTGVYAKASEIELYCKNF